MKHLLIIAILASFFSFSAFAEGQTDTECPMIRASRDANAKLNLDKSPKKLIRSNTSKGLKV